MKTTDLKTRSMKRTSANEVMRRLEELCDASQSGERLPTRAELVKLYDASERSVLRALDALESANKVMRRQGSGVFVAQPSPASAGGNVGTQRDSVAAKVSGAHGVQEVAEVNASTRTIGMTAYVDEELLATGQELPATLNVLKSIEGNAGRLKMKTHFINRWTAPGVPQLSPVECVRQLLEEGCNSVIVLDIYSHPYVLSELRSMRDLNELPVIYVSNSDDYVPCSHVYYDNRDAGYQAATALLDAGYKTITFFSPYAGAWAQKRIKGARIACSAHKGIDFRCYPATALVPVNDVQADSIARNAMCEALDQGYIQGGIVAAHDNIALNLLETAPSHGLQVGRDYGLIAFDDVPPSFTAGLSTMRPPLESLGREAIRLAAGLSSDDYKSRTVSLRAHLVKRKTHCHL